MQDFNFKRKQLITFFVDWKFIYAFPTAQVLQLRANDSISSEIVSSQITYHEHHTCLSGTTYHEHWTQYIPAATLTLTSRQHSPRRHQHRRNRTVPSHRDPPAWLCLSAQQVTTTSPQPSPVPFNTDNGHVCPVSRRHCHLGPPELCTGAALAPRDVPRLPARWWWMRPASPAGPLSAPADQHGLIDAPLGVYWDHAALSAELDDAEATRDPRHR